MAWQVKNMGIYRELCIDRVEDTRQSQSQSIRRNTAAYLNNKLIIVAKIDRCDVRIEMSLSLFLSMRIYSNFDISMSAR